MWRFPPFRVRSRDPGCGLRNRIVRRGERPPVRLPTGPAKTHPELRASVFGPYLSLGGPCLPFDAPYSRGTRCSFTVLFHRLRWFPESSFESVTNRRFVFPGRAPDTWSIDVDEGHSRPLPTKYTKTTGASSPSIVMGSGGLHSSHGCVPFGGSNNRHRQAEYHDISPIPFGKQLRRGHSVVRNRRVGGATSATPTGLRAVI